MRALLLGKNGQLGWELQRALAPLGEVVALDLPEIDLTIPDSVRQAVQAARPQVIVNATAHTDVDRAEVEPEIAMAVNGYAPGLLAELASSMGAALIHYSTDYVFDGNKGSPYVETDTPYPINTYGRSKLSGEQAISQTEGAYLILRTSWVYSLRCESFVTKVLRWSRQRLMLRVVSDQIGNPTWARMLAEATSLLLASRDRDLLEWIHDIKGIYHLAGEGYASRFEWAQAILNNDPHKEDQIARKIQPALTSEFTTSARRPLNSTLNCDLFASTFGMRLPAWEHALKLAMQVE